MRKIVIVTVALALLLAACGGSSDKNSSGNNGSSNNSAGNAFTQLSDKSKNATFRVTYQSTDENGEKQDAWTLSQEGSSKKAYITDNTKVVVDGDKAYSCNDLDTTPTCEELPGGSQGASAMIAGFTGFLGLYSTALAAAGNAGFTDKSDETIAGRSAKCVQWTVGGALSGIAKSIADKLAKGAGYESCVDKETGVLLRAKIMGDGKSSSIEATTFTTPEASDFETPTTTTTTAEGDSGSTDTTDTTEATSDTTADSGDSGSGPCMTLPNNITLPNGITIPCVHAP